MSAIVFGPTGLCGLEILKRADTAGVYLKVTAVARRAVKYSGNASVIVTKTPNYAEIFAEARPTTAFSALATTRAAAGSAQAFIDIDYGINYEIAKAAKDAGVETFVLVSAVGADALSRFLYWKTKGRLEEAIINLNFKKVVILRPAALLGEREKLLGGPLVLSEKFFGLFHHTWLGDNLFFPIQGSEVAKVAVHLAKDQENGVRIISAKEMVQLARKLE